jgi:hypothetical protein
MTKTDSIVAFLVKQAREAGLVKWDKITFARDGDAALVTASTDEHFVCARFTPKSDAQLATLASMFGCGGHRHRLSRRPPQCRV